MEKLRKSINAVVALLLVGAAGLGTFALMATRPQPPRSANGVRAPEVVAFEATPGVFDAPVVGFGTIQPGNQIKVIPQVSGMLTGMHADLAVGKNIAQGEVLFEIDARTYESQVLQVEADIKMLEVQLERQKQTEIDLTERLALAREQLDLADENLKREQGLLDEGAGSVVERDAARERYLQYKDAVLGYGSQLALAPHQVAEINARLEARRAQLADARRNLDNTKIVCPFDARVDLVSARTSQVVVANFAIAALTDLSALELPTVLEPSELQWVDRRAYARVMGGDLGEPPVVKVTWTLHDQRYSWSGRVSRLERHDEMTRTARVVIEIPQSLEAIRATQGEGNPPLSVGMFCSAELPAEPLRDALVLPRSAIREDNVVCVFVPEPGTPVANRCHSGRKGRLALRQVPMLRNVGDHVLVDFAGRDRDDRLSAALASAACELEPGEWVITSPLARPVAGMELRLRDGAGAVAAVDEAWTADIEPFCGDLTRPTLLASIQLPHQLTLPLAHEVVPGGR